MEQNTKQIRELTKEIRIGDRVIGGSYPILIQSMTNTKTQDVDATVEQILRLEDAGCEIIRCTVPDMEAAKAIGEIKKRIHIPLVADIHFDYRLAIEAVKNGAKELEAYVVKDGQLHAFTLKLGEMTPEEREIILKGCLINYNRV